MPGMKYVIVKDADILKPILFDTLLPHNMFQNHTIVSAGFVGIYSNPKGLSVSVWGKSITLDIQSDQNDEELIKRSLERIY